MVSLLMDKGAHVNTATKVSTLSLSCFGMDHIHCVHAAKVHVYIISHVHGVICVTDGPVTFASHSTGGKGQCSRSAGKT